ncbi:MAG: HAD-IIA family hydrolase, partial [Actinobacteria bacterium]|nr:HAD-IIA family hydrolase [Actinomycetota bacterium]
MSARTARPARRGRSRRRVAHRARRGAPPTGSEDRETQRCRARLGLRGSRNTLWRRRPGSVPGWRRQSPGVRGLWHGERVGPPNRGSVSDPVVVCDLDGVVWRGELAVGGSADAIATLRAAGIHVAFLTNNSSNPVGHVVERLAACGVAAEPADVLTSAQAAASLLAEGLPAGARVLACAGAGVREALAAAGYVVVEDGAAEAVVVGWHREFDFERLDRAAQAVRGGARFVATNTDPTYPDARRVLPGAGAIVAAVATAAGRAPEVAGKPHRATAELVRAR